MTGGARAGALTLTRVEKGAGVSKTYIRVDTGYLDAYHDSIVLDFLVKEGILTDSGYTVLKLKAMGIEPERIQQLQLPEEFNIVDEAVECEATEENLPARAIVMAFQIVHISHTFSTVKKLNDVLLCYRQFLGAETKIQNKMGIQIQYQEDRTIQIAGETYSESDLAYWIKLL